MGQAEGFVQGGLGSRGLVVVSFAPPPARSPAVHVPKWPVGGQRRA